MAPTVSLRKGEIVSIGRQSQARVQQTGVWSVSSEGAVAESTSLDEHLLFLLNAVEPVAKELTELCAERGWVMDFFCYWLSLGTQGGPIISPGTLRRMGELNAELGIDFYDGSDLDP